MRTKHESRIPGAGLVIKLRRESSRISVTFARQYEEKDLVFWCPQGANEIRSLIAGLRLEAGSRQFCPSNYVGLSADKKRALIRPLEQLGFELFNAIFEPAAAAFLEASVARIEAQGEAGDPPVVLIYNETVAVPWEMLVAQPGEPDAPLGKSFLGTRILFVNRVAQDGNLAFDIDIDDPFDALDLDPDRVAVGHLYDDKLPSCGDPAQIAWQQPHFSRLNISLMDPLDNDLAVRPAMQDAIIAFVARGHDVLHFDAHAKYEASEEAARTTIRLRSGYEAYHRDVSAWRLRPNVDTLVILNFCDSDTSCWDHDSIARRMQRNGAVTVIGTSSPISDDFTGTFLEDFYERLLDERPVGLALHETRSALLSTTQNPSALYYALHGAAGHELIA